jgi:hypothetical protein
VAEWEADIRIRRNGRLVKQESALADDPASALYLAHNDIERWAQDHSEAANEAPAQEVAHHA